MTGYIPLVRGVVTFVGAGPGDPGLLTLRGVRVIAAADAMFYDTDVHPWVIAHGRSDARRVPVAPDGVAAGEVPRMMGACAREGLRVVRVTGGDPWLSARVVAEANALARESVCFERVPGVTTATGAPVGSVPPAYAQPLAGRRVLVTRAREQSGAFVQQLMDRGADPVELPVIRFADATDVTELPRAIDALVAGAYALVAFTSQNGVDYFFRCIDAKGLDARVFANARVAAIGPATADTLRARGIRADAVPKEYVGEGIARAIVELLGPQILGARVLIPRAESARDALPDALRAAGALPEVVAAYRTVAATGAEVAAVRGELAHGAIDVVTFTSGSTVTQLCDALGADAAKLLQGCVIASIGPITSDTVRARGLAVSVEAENHTLDGLLDALDAHFTPC